MRLRRVRDRRRAVGAVVLGGDFQGLAIVRSLGRRGVPVCVLDDERSISRYSRYCMGALHVPTLGDSPRTIEILHDARRRLGLDGWVLYPTRDATVAALARHREELAPSFRVPTPRWETVRYACDKRNTYRLASELGIPTPRTSFPRNADDMGAVEGDGPFAVKPAVTDRFRAVTRAKAWRAENRAELQELLARAERLLGKGEMIVQDIVPGGGRNQLAYCAFFRRGDAVGTMVVRRLRQHPPEFGRASTHVETADVPVLEELSEAFLRAVGYYGLAELEYKLDERDGQYRLLDFNARTWGYHGLGQLAGVDFPYLLFADQVGAAPAPCRARAGVVWTRLVTDLPTGLLEIRRGNLRPREYLRSLARTDGESVFSRDDPLPALVELALVPYLAVVRGF
jgi:predicted ATP-grasp superfamily ATP-dependent carboligase